VLVVLLQFRKVEVRLRNIFIELLMRQWDFCL